MEWFVGFCSTQPINAKIKAQPRCAFSHLFIPWIGLVDACVTNAMRQGNGLGCAKRF